MPDCAKVSGAPSILARPCALVLLLAAAGYLLLIAVTRYPPLIDWPNHMARHWLGAQALAGAELPPGYAIRYTLVPNLGGDLVVPVLLQVLPTHAASAVFLLLTVLACGVGFCRFIARQATGPQTTAAAALLVLPWLITSAFFWGFINYVLALGLAFVAISNYLRLADQPEPSPLVLALHGLLVALLYVCHLAGLIIYLVLHGCHLAMQLIEQRHALRTEPVRLARFWPAVVVLLPAALLVLAGHVAGGERSAIAGAVAWDGIGRKIVRIASLFAGYSTPADAVVLALWAGAVAAMVKVEQVRALRFDWLALAALAFTAGYFAMPFDLGTTSGADSRLLPPALVCALALLARLPARNVALGCALLAAALVVRQGSIARAWAVHSAQAAEHVRFMGELPLRSRILSLQLDQDAQDRRRPWSHAAAFAVPERLALVSSLFAIAGQQPLRIAVGTPDHYFKANRDGGSFAIDRVRADFDYVWLVNPRSRSIDVPAAWQAVHRAGDVQVWRVR